MDKRTEAETTLAELEDPNSPPAYTPFATETSLSNNERSNSSQSDGNINFSREVALHHPFPTVLSAYCQLKFTRVFHLGDTVNHKLYAVSSYAGISSRSRNGSSVVLHNGPSDDDPVLAVAGEDSTWSYGSAVSIITLPPLASTPGSRGIGATTPTETDAAREVMQPSLLSDLKTVVFRFSIEVGNRNRRESFEWRKIEGEELDSNMKHGFKLVRLRSDLIPFRGDGEHGDESEEPVAKVGWKHAWSLKPFTIQFLGAGLTGELGDRWALMAVMTGLRVWYLDMQKRTTASAVGGSLK